MKKRRIITVLDKDVCCDVKTGEPLPSVEYADNYADYCIVSEGTKNVKLEDLVILCDRDAENCNAHEFVGSHRLLGAILFNRIGRDKATEVFADIAERGGLHGMNGMTRHDDSYADLGVGTAGRDDWSGTYSSRR